MIWKRISNYCYPQESREATPVAACASNVSADNRSTLRRRLALLATQQTVRTGQPRSMRLETLETRKLMAADPIHVGVVYLETDYLEADVGSDSQGDRFLLSFTGGAPGTQLRELRIQTDKYGDGISIGDPMFDTSIGGRGKNGAHDFKLAPGQTENVEATVQDGGQELILRFEDFRVGDQLEFTLDVDEVLRNSSDLTVFNQELDVITSGQEFQNSILNAVFEAPNYYAATADAIFLNDYGDPAADYGLDLPPDESADIDSRPNRSAAAVGTVTQLPVPASISGFVYRDDNDSATKDLGEPGLSGVRVRLEPLDTIEPQSSLITTTGIDGSYEFTGLMPGRYQIIELDQPADLADGRDAAGTIAGRIVGTAINPGDEIRNVVLNGGDSGVNYNFGELPLGSIQGFVYLAAPGADCTGDHEADGATPLADVNVELVGPSGEIVATTKTIADGSYTFDDLRAGTYSIVERTPANLFDGESHVGQMRTLASNLRVRVGQSVDAGRIDDVSLSAGGEGTDYNFCEVNPASLSGHVYHDRDDDGQRESGEEPISGVTLNLVNSAGATVATTTTNDRGEYRFDNLQADTYRIVESQPTGFIDGRDTVGRIAGTRVGSTGSDSDSLVDIVLRQGLQGVDYDFGERQLASLSGLVHVDVDEDCFMDENEDPLAGVTIDLLNEAGDVVATTQTGADGRYLFADLVPGNYTVVEHQPVGYFEGGSKPGSAGGLRLGPSRIGDVALRSGEVAVDYDFCERPPAEISGWVYVDRNADCFRDDDEEGLSGVVVELLDGSGQVIATTTTGTNGLYRFTNLQAGEYTVRETQPAGYFHGGQRAGRGGGDDSSADLISTIPISWGDSLTQYNFCELLPSELSGVVYVDRDADCVRDSGEEGLSGVVVELLDDSGRVIATTTTDANGSYRFGNLQAGEYTVREIQPAGYFHGGQQAGSGGGDDSSTDVISRIPISWGDTLTQYNFCERLPSELSGVVYVDRDADCIQDFDEVGLSGVRVELFNEAGQLVETTTSGVDGTYQFTNLPAGVYTVRETQPDGYFHGGQKAGSGGGDDSVADVISDVQLFWGESLTRYDFCELLPASLSGRVWSDLNRNSTFDSNEAAIPNVLIELSDDSGQVIQTTTTDTTGSYRFEGLRPGTYQVFETQPDGYFQGGQVVGDQGGQIIRADTIGQVPLRAGVDAKRYDFPELPPAMIAGYVFQDGDELVMQEAPDPASLREFRDGRLTDDDMRLAGVTLQLRNVLGLPVDSSTSALPGSYSSGPITVTTDASGYYEFTGLRPIATYSVYQVQPEGFIDSLDTVGSTGGVALNQADLASTPSVATLVSTLSGDAATDPKFDAIFNLLLAPGEASVQNNFSEINIEPPTQVPPEESPDEPVDRPLVAVETFDTFERPIAFAEPLDIRPPMTAVDEWAVSWHLSVINGGFPRGDGGAESGFVNTGSESTIVQKAGFRSDGQTARDEDRATGQLHESLLKMNLGSGKWQIQVSSANSVKTLEASRTGDPIQLGHSDAFALTGDFDGDSVDEPVLFLGGQWFVDFNGNGIWDAGDLWVRLGTKLDRPVVGDWDGDGKDDVGIFGRRWENDDQRIRRDPGLPDPANKRRRQLTREDLVHREPTEQEKRQRVLMRGEDGELQADAVDHVFQYGEQVDTPLAGDWNGDGIDQIGVFRSGQWLLDEDGDGRWTQRDRPSTFGRAGDEPIVGDFDGDGIDEIGVVRGDLWIIDTDGDRKITGNDKQVRVPRDTPDSQPIVGDFDGDDLDDPGYYQAAS